MRIKKPLTEKQLAGLALGRTKGINRPGNFIKNPSMRALHMWVRLHKPLSDKCERCRKISPVDAANISQKYYRDINDFEWLCRKCHINGDGRIKNNLKQYRDNQVYHDEYEMLDLPSYKKYRLRHPERVKAYQEKYRKKNIERIRKRDREKWRKITGTKPRPMVSSRI